MKESDCSFLLVLPQLPPSLFQYFLFLHWADSILPFSYCSPVKNCLHQYNLISDNHRDLTIKSGQKVDNVMLETLLTDTIVYNTDMIVYNTDSSLSWTYPRKFLCSWTKIHPFLITKYNIVNKTIFKTGRVKLSLGEWWPHKNDFTKWVEKS